MFNSYFYRAKNVYIAIGARCEELAKYIILKISERTAGTHAVKKGISAHTNLCLSALNDVCIY